MSEPRETVEPPAAGRIYPLLLVSALLIVAGLGVWWLVQRADREMREEWQQQARLVAQSLNVRHLRALKGTAEDLGSPDYERLKELLAYVRTATEQCRFIYLLGRRANAPGGTNAADTADRIFMLVDSEPPGSEDYSPPGQAYEEATDELLRVFATGKGTVEGPASDRWGTWVSPLVPVLDPTRDSERVIAVLGMDIDARTWKRDALARAALPAGLVVAALTLLAVSLVAVRSNRIVRRQRATVLESEERYRALVEKAGEAIVVIQDGRFAFANASAARLVGVRAEELIGRPFLDFIHPEDRPLVAERYRMRSSGIGSPAHYEFRGVSANGETHYVELDVVGISWKGAAATLNFLRDITERKRAEARVQQNLERAQRQRAAIVKMTTNDAVIAGDKLRGFQILTEAASEAAGVARASVWLLSETQEELVCADLYEAGLKNHSAGARLNYERYPRYFAALRAESRICATDARTDARTQEFAADYLIPLNITSMLDASIHVAGRLAGMICLEHIGEPREWQPDEEAFAGTIASLAAEMLVSAARKRAEEEREKLRAQLSQAQKMESVGRLAGGVAHDFNNMLQAILGNAALALMDLPRESPLRVHLEEIQRSAQRSADLTRQLLAFARKQTIAPKVLDLNETVEGMLKMLRRLIGEDIDLAWLPGKNLGTVRVDPSQIDQLLANLCVNARDAIGGVGKVTIETSNMVFSKADVVDHPDVEAGEYVRLAVTDNGCGMNAEVMAHLFEPFFTTKPTGQGTGLGLATVYGIAKQNGGFVTVRSEPGKGTCFQIHLPRCATSATQTGMEDMRQPLRRGNETILLVEDEPAILRAAGRMLENLGYTVVAAATPREAIRLAEQHPATIHLLVTDVVMPEMNGRDLAERLRSRFPNLKRVFISGYTANVIAHHGVLDEGVHFIQKPFSITALADKVHEALSE